MKKELVVLSIVFLTIGVLIRYWRSRRKFYRKNVAGIERFSSYHKALIIRWGENIALKISNVCFAVGILLLLFLVLKYAKQSFSRNGDFFSITRDSFKDVEMANEKAY